MSASSSTEIIARLRGDSAQLDATVKKAFQNMQVEAQRAARSVEPLKRAFGSGGLQGGFANTGRGLDAMGGKTRNAGMAMLQLGQFADDAQYGLRGVVNNMPSLVASLGGGAGLAGAIGIVAVAANQVYSFLEKDIKALKEMGKASEHAADLAAGLVSVADAAGRVAKKMDEVKASNEGMSRSIESTQKNMRRDQSGIGAEFDAQRSRNSVLDERRRLEIEGLTGVDKHRAAAELQRTMASRDAKLGVDEAAKNRDVLTSRQSALRGEAARLQREMAAADARAKIDRATAERSRDTAAYAGRNLVAEQSEQKAALLRGQLGEATKGLESYSEALMEANAAYARAVQELNLLPERLKNVDIALRNKIAGEMQRGARGATDAAGGPGWRPGRGGRFGGIFSGASGIDLDKVNKDSLRALQQESRGSGRGATAARGPQAHKTFGGLGSASFGGLDDLSAMQDSNYVLGSGAATSRRSRRGAPQPFGPGNEGGSQKQNDVLTELRGLRTDVRSLKDPTKPKATADRS